jgi:hypothetical protein
MAIKKVRAQQGMGEVNAQRLGVKRLERSVLQKYFSKTERNQISSV